VDVQRGAGPVRVPWFQHATLRLFELGDVEGEMTAQRRYVYEAFEQAS